MLLDCGHPPTSLPSGSIGTGYSRSSEGTMCYSCGDDHVRELMKTEDQLFAYMSQTQTRLITWSGGDLGRIEGRKITRNRRMIIAWVTDCHGQRWIGRGSAQNGDYLKLRRLKGK